MLLVEMMESIEEWESREGMDRGKVLEEMLTAWAYLRGEERLKQGEVANMMIQSVLRVCDVKIKVCDIRAKKQPTS